MQTYRSWARRYLRWLALAAVLGASTAARPVASPAPSPRAVELRVDILARPFAAKREEARRINDLCLYEGRLYLGHGDYAVDTGPTDVVAYDPATGACTTEFTVDDEAITCFRVLDGRLVIPGADATESWELGNVYVREEGRWTKCRSLPRAVHVLDVASLGRGWFAGTGIAIPMPDDANLFALGAVFTSADRGKSWQVCYCTPGDAGSVARIGALAAYKGRVFAFPYTARLVPVTQVPPAARRHLRAPVEHPGTTYYLRCLPILDGLADAVVFDDLWHPQDLIPTPDVCRIDPVVVGDRLVMVVTSGTFVPGTTHCDAESFEKLGTASMSLWTYDGRKAARIPLEVGFVRDTVAHDGRLSVLALRHGRWTIASSGNLEAWVFQDLPALPAPPLSIERDGDAFYLGLNDGALLKAQPR